MVRSLLVAVVVALAGCGGDDGVVLVGRDGGVDACPSANACNPLGAPGQQWCPAGQRCGAVILAPGAVECPTIATMGCVPDGTVPLGQPCVWTTPGATPGHDDCVAGAVCSSDGVCRDVCGFSGGPEAACAGGLTCYMDPGRFEPQGGGEPLFGVCAPPR